MSSSEGASNFDTMSLDDFWSIDDACPMAALLFKKGIVRMVKGGLHIIFRHLEIKSYRDSEQASALPECKMYHIRQAYLA